MCVSLSCLAQKDDCFSYAETNAGLNFKCKGEQHKLMRIPFSKIPSCFSNQIIFSKIFKIARCVLRKV